MLKKYLGEFNMVKRSSNEGVFPTQVPKKCRILSVLKIGDKFQVELLNGINPNNFFTTSTVKEIIDNKDGFSIKTLNSQYAFFK